MTRVLRGGSFNNEQRNVRCAYRNRNNPNDHNDNNGFRVCASHIVSAAGNAARLRLRSRGLMMARSASWPRQPCLGRIHKSPALWAQAPGRDAHPSAA